MAPPLPWQEAGWRRVLDAVEAERLAHALVLRGREGVGKTVFARRLVAALLCESEERDGIPCDRCRGCHLLASGAHPDAIEVVPLEGKRSISIDQVRELIEDVSLTAQYAGRKVVLIAPVDALTIPAVNTLLKTLEEPPGDSVFVLVAHLYGLLPATVRSRCQTIDLPAPPVPVATAWLADQGVEEAKTALEFSNGAPLLALQRARNGLATPARLARLIENFDDLAQGRTDPLQTANEWREVGLFEVNAWLLSLAGMMIKKKCAAGRKIDDVAGVDGDITRLAQGIDIKELFALVDNALDVRFLEASQTPVNEQLSLEALALRWARALASG